MTVPVISVGRGQASSQSAQSVLAVSLEMVAVFLSATTIYVLTLAGDHSMFGSHNAIPYTVAIRDSAASETFNGMWNPYHLIYNWLGRAVYDGARAADYPSGPLVPVQVLDALLGGLGIAALWGLLRSVTQTRLAAVATCGMLAFSYSYWRYSTEVEVWTLSAFLLIIALYSLYQAVEHPQWRMFLLAGLASGLAVLGHEMNGLFGVVAIVALTVVWRRTSRRRALQCWVAYSTGALLTSLPVYAFALYVTGQRTFNAAQNWLTGMSQEGTWGHLRLANGYRAVKGLLTAFVGTVSLSHYSPFILVLALVGSSVVVGVFLLIGAFAISAVRKQQNDNSTHTLLVLSGAWFVAYALFATWWFPEDIEFWIVPLIPVAILFGLAVVHMQSRRARAVNLYVTGAVVLTLLFVNYLGRILPTHDASQDPTLTYISWYRDHTGPEDLIVTDGWTMSGYLRYFTPAKVIELGEVYERHRGNHADALAEIEKTIAAKQTGNVYVNIDPSNPAGIPDLLLADPRVIARDGPRLIRAAR